jgi:hypothetical protein
MKVAISAWATYVLQGARVCVCMWGGGGRARALGASRCPMPTDLPPFVPLAPRRASYAVDNSYARARPMGGGNISGGIKSTRAVMRALLEQLRSSV